MADLLRRLGLIINPHAGHGAQANLATAQKAMNALRPVEIVAGPGELGAAVMSGWSGTLEVCPKPGAGREQTQQMAREMIRRRVDALVVIGGDGTLADVAQVCLEGPRATPILGIGVGSTNVGRLITCRGETVTMLDPAQLQPQAMDGVLAYCNGELLGLGFNDGVIGFTVVGTLDGQMRDVDAAEKLNGRNIPGTPRVIGAPRTRVTRANADGALTIAQGEAVGTVVVGFAERSFFGKAITGGVCLTALVGLPAGCLVCDRPLVQVEVDVGAALSWPPLVSHYVSLDEGTRVVVEGVREGAALCADGNPLRLLVEGDRAEFAVRRAAVTVLRLAE